MFQKLMFLDSSKKAAIGMSCLRVFCDTMSVVKVCTFDERVKGFLMYSHRLAYYWEM